MLEVLFLLFNVPFFNFKVRNNGFSYIDSMLLK